MQTKTLLIISFFLMLTLIVGCSNTKQEMIDDSMATEDMSNDVSEELSNNKESMNDKPLQEDEIISDSADLTSEIDDEGLENLENLGLDDW